jgi:prepilin-type N-terminal cleavage/methylation domain-containing protein
MDMYQGLFRQDRSQVIKGKRCTARAGIFSVGGGQSGMTLIEILVALGILAAAAVVFLLGMAASSSGVIISQERVAVDSLAKSEMEYIKNLSYDDVNNPPVYEVDPGLSIPSGYNMVVTALRLDPEEDGTADDDGIQQITVTITRNGETASSMVGYKFTPAD